MDKKPSHEFTDVIENILPTTNEEEMKNLMKDLDREQAYREHKCWRQSITVIVSIAFVIFQFLMGFVFQTHLLNCLFFRH